MRVIFAAAVVFAAVTVPAIERTDLGGLWDFAFTQNASVANCRPDFTATDRMMVPGCFDLMPNGMSAVDLDHTVVRLHSTKVQMRRFSA
jgi:hypothetical protein